MVELKVSLSKIRAEITVERLAAIVGNYEQQVKLENSSYLCSFLLNKQLKYKRCKIKNKFKYLKSPCNDIKFNYRKLVVLVFKLTMKTIETYEKLVLLEFIALENYRNNCGRDFDPASSLSNKQLQTNFKLLIFL